MSSARQRPPISLIWTALLLALGLASACGGRSAPRTTVEDPSQVDLRELWIEPSDISSRDLFHGAGGESGRPDATGGYELVSLDETGFSRGYDVRDDAGTEWSVKLGPEAQSEIVASRLLWAIGFHQPPTYFVASWTLRGKISGPQGAARFRPEPADIKVVSEWSWYENPFAAARPFKGLIVANLILNNWDLKTSNNRVYERTVDGERPRRAYVVRDLGASLGKTTFPALLKWTPMRAMSQGTRNDLEGFEEQGFIRGADGSSVQFHYRGIHDALVSSVSVEDVVWTCRLFARLTDRQWDDAFRAAGYSEAHRKRFVAKLKSKVAEGLELAPATSR